jgi:hypothetical protein
MDVRLTVGPIRQSPRHQTDLASPGDPLPLRGNNLADSLATLSRFSRAVGLSAGRPT